MTKVEIAKNITEITQGEVFTVNNILFDFDKSSLKKSSYEELNKVVDFMKNNKDVKIELSAHTDNIGSEGYNLILSNFFLILS